MTTAVRVGDGVTIGDGSLALIAGPCVLETEALALTIAERCKEIAHALGLPYVFKASFDKANRTAITSYRGPELARGLEMLRRVRTEVGVPVLTDIHESSQAGIVAEVADVLQIPAFLCRQTDLLAAAAATGKVVNIKKGQFLAPWDLRYVIGKLEDAGAEQILVTERGTCFGYNTLVVDFRSLELMREFERPIVFDATHSVQAPGGAGSASSGERRFVPPLARAAVAVGVDALFVEVHPDPDSSPSDGPNMIALDCLRPMLEDVVLVAEAAARAR